MKSIAIIAVLLVVCSNAYARHGSFVPKPLGDMSGLKRIDGTMSENRSGCKRGSNCKNGFDAGRKVKVMQTENLKNRLPASTPNPQKGIRPEKVNVAAIRQKVLYFQALAQKKKEAEARERSTYMCKAVIWVQ